MGYFLTIWAFICLIAVPAISQVSLSATQSIRISIPEVAMVGISAPENAGTVHLSKPESAGHSLQAEKAVLSGYWLNYSSIARNDSHERKIMAALTGDIPRGLTVKVDASPATGNGNGRQGIPVGKRALTQAPVEIISGIGSCYTGTGEQNGHHLTYSIEIDHILYGEIRQNESCRLMVTYTILE